MTQTEMPQKIEHLKRFLITRLLGVMIFIFISESIINLIANQVVFPILNSAIKTELFLAGKSSGDTLFLLLRVVALLILSGIDRLLPGVLSGIFPYVSANLWKNSALLTKMSVADQVLIFVIMFGFLCIYLLPYVAGIIYYSGVVMKKMEEVREYDRKQREEFTRKRNLLLSDITHDLKTPITTIAGYVQAINDGMVKDPEKQKQYLNAIRRKSLEMSELITLLFNYVKLDSEGFELKKERTNITELILQIVAGAYADIEAAGMKLDIDILEEAGYAEIDRVQFSRAFMNLITNAIKHNETGTTIRISMKKNLGDWVIKVMDSGEKIDPALVTQLFDPFVMGDESRNSRGGSGLGLSVSKKVIEMHGGKLFLEQPTEENYTKAFCIWIRQQEERAYEYGQNKVAKSEE